MRITTRGRKRDLHNQESFHLKVKFQKFKFNFWGGLFMMGGKNVESMQLRNASLPVVKCSNNSDCPYDITCNGSTSQCDCSDILNMGQRDCGMAFVKKCKARFLQDGLNDISLEIVLSLLKFFSFKHKNSYGLLRMFKIRFFRRFEQFSTSYISWFSFI